MNIRERIQTEFPGITAMIAGFADALRAYHAYNRGLEDIEALKMVEKEKLINEANESLSERMSEELFSAVHQAVGHVSVCWTKIDGAWIFDAKEAGNIALELCNLIADEIEKERDAACGYIETTTKREVAVTEEGDIR